MSVNTLLTQTFTVQELTTGQSAMGGHIKSYSTRTDCDSLYGLINAKKLTEAEDGKTISDNVYKLYLEYTSVTTTVEKTDRVIFGSRTFEIKGIYNPANRNVLLQIDLEEID